MDEDLQGSARGAIGGGADDAAANGADKIRRIPLPPLPLPPLPPLPPLHHFQQQQLQHHQFQQHQQQQQQYQQHMQQQQQQLQMYQQQQQQQNHQQRHSQQLLSQQQLQQHHHYQQQQMHNQLRHHQMQQQQQHLQKYQQYRNRHHLYPPPPPLVAANSSAVAPANHAAVTAAAVTAAAAATITTTTVTTTAVMANSTAQFPGNVQQPSPSNNNNNNNAPPLPPLPPPPPPPPPPPHAMAAVVAPHAVAAVVAPYAEAAERSDSGMSSSRTLNSGDERSGSHSSAFSGSDDHAAAVSPSNEQHQMPPSPFNNIPVWRDPHMLQTPNGPAIHVGSVQHQNYFMPNAMQMPQMMLPYQLFPPPSVGPPPPMPPQMPTPIMQPALGTAGMLWRPPTVAVTNANNNSTAVKSYYHHHRPNEQHKSNSSRGNVEKDSYKEMKRAKQPQYAQGSAGGSKSKGGGVPSENGSNNDYGQMEIEQMVNRHQRGNREHTEKQQAEAAVHQHFEESLKIAQQQRRTNWISNLPSPPKNVYPSQGHKIQDSSKHRHTSLNGINQMANHQVGNWKEKKNKYIPYKLTPIDTSPSQAHYRNWAVPKSNFDHENVLTNANDSGNTGNHNNMISYASYMNSNHVYIPPSNSSVIVRNDSSYKSSSIPVPEAYLYNRTPTILTVPAVKLESNKDPRQAKSMHYSRPLSSSVNTSQSKGYNSSTEPHHPGPLLNTHGRYALYPPLTDKAQRDLETPPPAHLNAMMSTSALPTFVPVVVPVDDLQTEALDLVMICNKATPETDVPLHLNSNYQNFKQDPQDTINTLDINVPNNSKKRNYSEIDLPNNGNVSSSLTTLTSNLATDSVILSKTLSFNNSLAMPSSLSEAISQNESITISTANLTTVSTSIPPTVSMIDSKPVPTSNLKSTPLTDSTDISTVTSASAPVTSSTTKSSTIVTTSSSVTTSSNVPISSSTTYDASPSTPPPVLIPATYTEMSSGVRTHHHKLKKAWLQRHVWAEDLKEAGVNIDQNSPQSLSQMEDTPPVLQCEIVKKRKISKNSSNDNTKVTSPPVILPSTSSSLYEPSTSSGTGTKRCRKRKISNPTTSSETRSTADNARSSETEKKVPPIKIPKKRGRKPKVIVSIPLKKGKNNDGEVRFFQSGPCLNAGPKIHKCRECRIYINNKKNDIMSQDEIDNIFCRFYAFRRLFTNKTGQLVNAGFPDPFLDITMDDANLWLPDPKCPPTSLNVKIAKKILIEAGRQFCYLVKEENKALTLSPYFQGKPIAWKKAANGVREMCDVCLTSIFNYHWACAKCGFGVCIDCVKARLNGSSKSPNAATMTKKDLREKDTFTWMTCNSKHTHDIERLMLTQIVASDSMDRVFSDLHKLSSIFNIAIECGCPGYPLPQLQGNVSTDDDDDDDDDVDDEDDYDNDELPSTSQASTSSAQKTAAEISKTSSSENLKNESDINSKTKLSEDLKLIPAENLSNNVAGGSKSNGHSQNTIDIEPQIAENTNSRRVIVQSHPNKKEALKHFVRKKNKYLRTIPRELLPPRAMTLAESREFFPNNPHTWLCEGKLLRLLDPENSTNYNIFQEQWKRGQPVMISDVGQRLNPEYWSPYSFSRDFGEFTNDLIDCATGLLIEGKTMKQFWDGFEDESKRLKGTDGKQMLLKLKDWPVGSDFSDTLPESLFRCRFDDLMGILPLKDYTLHDGKLNLAARLPACFVRPDLGPKMYSAYGNAGNRDSDKRLISTTNLHLDVSDTLNVMVYVAISRKNGKQHDEADHEWHIKEAYRAVDEAGCDMACRRRARDLKELPGAVWHIYHAKDADSIRDLLNKVSAERGEPQERNHDPIHDQSSYLDADLRARLYTEYGVQGYAVVQCLGDAIFIPAGAPHQVRNLHSCIKVACDFVSPENLSQCFRLMNDLHDLSSSHSLHEDKLQIKNIMFHAVKDSISVLLHEKLSQEELEELATPKKQQEQKQKEQKQKEQKQ